MKKSITKQEYIILSGLKAMADRNVREFENLVDLVGETIGEEKDYGSYDWSFDFLWDKNSELDTFLEQRKIEVGDE